MISVQSPFFFLSSIGALITRRSVSEFGAGSNETYGVDGLFAILDTVRINTYLARTRTPGLSGDDLAYLGQFDWNADRYGLQLERLSVGAHFNPEVGFTRRVGFRKVDAGVFHTWRPDGFWKFQELTPHMTFNRFWNFDGIMESSYAHLHFDGEFEDSSSAGIAYDIRSERVFETFKVSGLVIPPGQYDFNEITYSYNSDRSAPISAGIRATTAGFFSGNIVTIRPSIRARYGETFNLSLSYSRNDIDLPSGSTITNLTMDILTPRPDSTV